MKFDIQNTLELGLMLFQELEVDSEIEREILAHIELIKPKHRECYKNARMLSLHSKGKFQYCEGAAFDGHSNFEHAWNTYLGAIIEISPDSKGNAFQIGLARPEWRYCGYVFSLEEVQIQEGKVGMYKTGKFSDAGTESLFSMLPKEKRIKALMAVLPVEISKLYSQI